MNKQRRFKPALWMLACALVSLLSFTLISAQSSSDDFITITPKNADQLELGYVLPGFCGIADPTSNLTALWKVGIYDLATGQRRFQITSDFGSFSRLGNYFEDSSDGVIDVHTGTQILSGGGFFSPDEKYFVAREDGVYEVASHKQLFPIDTIGWFSPNSKLIAVENDAIYEVKTGKRLFDLPPGIVVFSPNSKYFAVWQNGVYDTATGKQLIASTGTIPEFSPDSQYVSISEDGVYKILTKQKLFTIDPHAPTAFSPDSKVIAITGDGVYDLATQKRSFRIGASDYYQPHFFEGSPWLDVSDDGIYNLTTRQQHYPISGILFSATKDASLIVIDQKGIFETATGDLKFRIGNAYFAKQDKLVLSLLFTLDEPASTFCGVYGIKGDKWPYRSGLVDTAHTQLYHAPNAEKRIDMQGRPITSDNRLAVFAQTADKAWLRVSDNTWVKASDVQPVSLPDGIPIENPS